MSERKLAGFVATGLSIMILFSLPGCGDRENLSLRGEDAPLTSAEEEGSAQELFGGISPEQRGSISMLNYMTVLAQKINEDKGNQLFLESAYSSLVNDIYPNAVDTKTQAQISNLLDTINHYRMIAVKRDRLRYIYDQNKARALRQAIPRPTKLINVNILHSAANVMNMAVDSVSSYNSAASLADKQFLQEGWKLEDEEMAQLHESTKEALNYMLNMVRDYDLPGDYVLSAEAVKDFVSWSGKPDSQLANKIAWFESHESAYQAFGPYWLGLVRSYYDYGDYEKCLEAMGRYEKIAGRIFRKDTEYDSALPMVLVAARETLGEEKYIQMAQAYCPRILNNIKDSDWSLRYFAAQIYLDLYSLRKDNRYLEAAYQANFDNVVVLVEEQKELNQVYLNKLQEEKAPKGATKRVKNEIKAYNKQAKKEREIALPPVNEPLYLSCKLLFELAEVMDLPQREKQEVDAILHENGERLFLTQGLDEDFWFYGEGQEPEVKLEDMPVTFEEEELSLPAICLTPASLVSVSVEGDKEPDILEGWVVKKVTRPKKAGCEKFEVSLTSKEGDKYKFHEGDVVTVTVSSMGEEEETDYTFQFQAKKKGVLLKKLDYERVES